MLLQATDPEEDALQYSITNGNINGDFSIDLNSGIVANSKKLDRETTDLYSLVIAARDDQSGKVCDMSC